MGTVYTRFDLRYGYVLVDNVYNLPHLEFHRDKYHPDTVRIPYVKPQFLTDMGHKLYGLHLERDAGLRYIFHRIMKRGWMQCRKGICDTCHHTPG